MGTIKVELDEDTVRRVASHTCLSADERSELREACRRAIAPREGSIAWVRRARAGSADSPRLREFRDGQWHTIQGESPLFPPLPREYAEVVGPIVHEPLLEPWE